MTLRSSSSRTGSSSAATSASPMAAPTCTMASPRVRPSAASTWPTTSRPPMPPWARGCCHRSQMRDPGSAETAAHSDQRRRFRLARAEGQRPG
jgi:hypothetical protein